VPGGFRTLHQQAAKRSIRRQLGRLLYYRFVSRQKFRQWNFHYYRKDSFWGFCFHDCQQRLRPDRKPKAVIAWQGSKFSYEVFFIRNFYLLYTVSEKMMQPV
jgi:hypothetical protein